MKKTLATSLIALLAACGGDSDQVVLGGSTEKAGGADLTAPPVTPGTQNEQAAGTAVPAAQAEFLAMAYQANLDEIALAQLAVERGANEDVRRVAQRLLTHHAYLNRQIAALNEDAGLTLPAAPSSGATARVEQFSGLSGEAFDRAYAGHVLQHHEQAVAQFRQQAPVDELIVGDAEAGGDETDAPARDIELFALDALPALQVHLQAAKALSGAIDATAYLVNMYRGGLAEIQLGQLALAQSENAEVRAFAQRMIDDHTQANERIAAEAQERGVPLPGEPGAEEIALAQELARMTGENFDKAYMNHNVIAHEVALAQTRGQIENAADTDVTGLAAVMLPALRAHLASAELLYESIVPDALFTAFAGGAGEILVSQLALQLSANDEVRQYAQTLIAEHRAANVQTRQLALLSARELPSEVDAAAARAYVSLSQESAEEFDAEFLESNVGLHQRAVRLVEGAPADEPSAEVQAFAGQLIEALRRHLQMANDLLASFEADDAATTDEAAQPGA